MTKVEVHKLYYRHIAAYVLHMKIDGQEPDERMMREIETGAGVDETFVYDFRRSLLAREYAIELLLDQKMPAPWWDNKFFEQSLENYAKSH